MKNIKLSYLYIKDPYFVEGLARNDRYYIYIDGKQVTGYNLCADTAHAVLEHLGYNVETSEMIDEFDL